MSGQKKRRCCNEAEKRPRGIARVALDASRHPRLDLRLRTAVEPHDRAGPPPLRRRRLAVAGPVGDGVDRPATHSYIGFKSSIGFLENIHKEILENIDIDKISNRLEFGISNSPMGES